MKKFTTEILIEAPADQVWNMLMDFKNYWHWNTHLPYWEGKAKPGHHIYITSFLHEKPVRFSAQVTNVVENTLFTYTEVIATPVIFKADHIIELYPVSPASCRLVQHECLGGLLVGLIWKKWLYKAMQCYRRMNQDLKRAAEKQYSSRFAPRGKGKLKVTV